MKPYVRTIQLDTCDVSARQREVMQLASQGQTDEEIAHNLGISIETVRTHCKRPRERFDISSRTHIVAIGLQSEFQAQLSPEPTRLDLLLQETA